VQTCDYLGVIEPPTTTTHDTCSHVVDASIARYDARLAHDVAQRDCDAQRARIARDARRDAYVDALASAPITLALRERAFVPRATPNAFAPRPPRVRRAPSDANACDMHARVGCTRCAQPTRGAPPRNAWETNAPHARTHMAPDPTCHHPLVKCTHKW